MCFEQDPLAPELEIAGTAGTAEHVQEGFCDAVLVRVDGDDFADVGKSEDLVAHCHLCVNVDAVGAFADRLDGLWGCTAAGLAEPGVDLEVGGISNADVR